MPTTHTSFMFAVEPGNDSGPHRFECSCGEAVTYSGHYFTLVEMQRHQAWHAKQEAAPFIRATVVVGDDGIARPVRQETAR